MRGQRRYLKIDVQEDTDDDGEDAEGGDTFCTELEPAEIIVGGSDHFASHWKRGVSSVYRRLSSWSLPNPRRENLFTLNESRLDFLMASPPPSPAKFDDVSFDDVVDDVV